MASDERRVHSRFPFTSRLEVRPNEGMDPIAQAVAIDVSVGGLGFRSSVPLAIGELIRVALRDAELYSLETDLDPMPRPSSGSISFEVEAVVRHIKHEGGDYVIGAERRPRA